METTTPIQPDKILAQRIEAGVLAQEALDQMNQGCSDDHLECVTPEELVQLIEEGREAKNDLIMNHIGLVRVIAVEASRRSGVPQADLFQEGCVALNQAVLKFDWRKGAFGPYAAMWVRAAVRRHRLKPWVPIEVVEVVDSGPDQCLEDGLVRDGLQRALDMIHPSQRRVLKLRTGWETHPYSRRDVALELGTTVAKVRCIEKSALEAMKTHWELAEAA
ncbi:MAG: sigma-70 family RNA polymerase sigma factor [Propionibacteriaceae bacterium]|nr:sigma-70 family RNA polymerase sigma factor [Propionibacteriaceae bacterium]